MAETTASHYRITPTGGFTRAHTAATTKPRPEVSLCDFQKQLIKYNHGSHLSRNNIWFPVGFSRSDPLDESRLNHEAVTCLSEVRALCRQTQAAVIAAVLTF